MGWRRVVVAEAPALSLVVAVAALVEGNVIPSGLNPLSAQYCT
jgi:hypothetical protein